MRQREMSEIEQGDQTVEMLQKENEILKKRCCNLSGGSWCSLCELNCRFRPDEDNSKPYHHHAVKAKRHLRR